MTMVDEVPGVRPVTVVRVEWADPRAVHLRRALDREMTERYTGRHDDDPDFAAKAAVAFAVDAPSVATTFLALDADGAAVGHAALRWLRGQLEVKRVIVLPQARGKGVARALMDAAERVARELGASALILQTGDRQPDAVALYERIGYRPIPIYEPYRAITNSLCFEKPLIAPDESVTGAEVSAEA